jgi:stage II sporulation protein D
MKKMLYYSALMLVVLIILPLMIVKSCGFSEDESIPQEQDQDQQQQYQKQVKIKVYFSNEKVTKTVPLEEYIKGVVAAEMPAEFGLEALKAQAVAARTYAYGRMKKIYFSKVDSHSDAAVCTDSTHCQAWKSKKAAIDNWGFFSGMKYWNKIARAVKETENTIITYNNVVINPVFHSNSGGKTENTEEVWEGSPVAYLKSVTSEGEDNSKDYKSSILISKKDFYNKLKEAYPEFKINMKNILKNIKITAVTTGGRVKTIKVGNVILKGTEVRTILSLRSANFSINDEDADSLKITTIGYGHGVGMSQWGANYLSKSGFSCEEIIKWYYTGVELSQIN